MGGHQGAVLGRKRTKNSTDKGGTGGLSAKEDDHDNILCKAKDFMGQTRKLSINPSLHLWRMQVGYWQQDGET